jgi:hypothetical protein
MIKSRKKRWAGHTVRTGEKKNRHNILVAKPEGNSPLGSVNRRQEDETEAALRETV